MPEGSFLPRAWLIAGMGREGSLCGEPVSSPWHHLAALLITGPDAAAMFVISFKGAGHSTADWLAEQLNTPSSPNQSLAAPERPLKCARK